VRAGASCQFADFTDAVLKSVVYGLSGRACRFPFLVMSRSGSQIFQTHTGSEPPAKPLFCNTVGTLVGMLLQYPYNTVGNPYSNVKGWSSAQKLPMRKVVRTGAAWKQPRLIHRTRWVRTRVFDSVCFVFGRIDSYVAVCPSFVSSLHQLVERIVFAGTLGTAGTRP